MESLYTLTAAIGGSLLVIQLIMTLVGMDSDLEVDADLDADVDIDGAADIDHAEAASFVKLSFRTLVAFLTFFGLAGLAAQAADWGEGASVGVAIASGVAAFFAASFAMRKIAQLQSSGTVNIRNCVGQPGKIYLRVPAAMSGQGSVTVSIQGRSIQYTAVTQGAEIPTNAPCRIVGMQSANTVLVDALTTGSNGEK